MDLRPRMRRLLAALWRGLVLAARFAARLARTLGARARDLRASAVWRRARGRVARAMGVAFAGGAAAAALLAFLATCLVRIEPGEIGVRQREWGAERGVQPVDHAGPGLFVSWPWRDTWHRLDGRTRVVTFASAEDGGELAPLEVRTREGNAARVSASVPCRVRAGEAHRIVASGSKLAYPRQVSTTIEKVLTQELARLSSDDFHDPELRRAVSDEALEILKEKLAAHHVEVDAVLIRNVEFQPTYEKTRQEQQLAGQAARTQEMLDQLAWLQLSNQFVAHGIERDRKDLMTRLTRVYDEAERGAKLELARQKLEAQALAQDLAARRSLRAAELDALHAQVRYAEEVVVTEQLARQESELELDLVRAEESLAAELSAEREAQRRAEEVELAALELERRRLEQTLASEEAALATELARSAEEARAAGRAQAQAVTRAAEGTARERRDAAELRYEMLLTEGELALEAAAVEGERLRGEVLATSGGRLWLAREAASRLRFGRVVLDPRDGRVPSPLDLDALGAMLIGRLEGPAPPAPGAGGGR